MAEFEQSITIPAPAQQVFDFIADVRNLPQYVPTTKRAETQGPERVVVQGEAEGHKYTSDGYLRADPNAMRLEWGADERHYSGYMEVSARDDGETDVTVHLSFEFDPNANPDEGPDEGDIRRGLDAALESIYNQVTGTGGKVESD